MTVDLAFPPPKGPFKKKHFLGLELVKIKTPRGFNDRNYRL